LDRNYGKAGFSKLSIEVRAILSQKLLDNARLSDAGRTIDHETWHTITRWIVDEVDQAFENAFGTRILNPTFLP
jgi:hypothetical protein